MQGVIGTVGVRLDMQSFLVLAKGTEEAWAEVAEAPVHEEPLIPAGFAWCGFSEEEWRGLCAAPRRAFLFVAAECGGLSARTRGAYREALEDGQYSRSQLVVWLCEEALRHGEALEAEPVMDMGELSALYERIAGRLGLGEAERFKRCLLDMGRRAAEASSGLLGALGLLGRRERWALAALAGALRQEVIIDGGATRPPSARPATC